ncbi:MAG: PHP-associated domain-containing protein [Patescibacteria group bacterium]
MKLKANLHFHTREDPQDSIPYTLHEGIDEAARLHFDVLALTLHNRFGYTKDAAEYARERGILLIPGIEKTIHGRHVVLLNCDSDAESIVSFEALAEYRKNHPDCFVLAPHPYYAVFSLKEKLEQYSDLFDAVEWSWYYSSWFHSANDSAREFAKNHTKPFIATSDTHRLRYLNRSYAMIDAESKDTLNIISALRRGMFENISRPSSLLVEIIAHQLWMTANDEIMRLLGKKCL